MSFYTNAYSTSNKEEKLKDIVQQENRDTVAITEMWWADSHSWSAAMDGPKLVEGIGQGETVECRVC